MKKVKTEKAKGGKGGDDEFADFFDEDFQEDADDGLDFKRIHADSPKWYEETKGTAELESTPLPFEEVQKLKKEAGSVFNNAVIVNKSKPPKSLAHSDYSWIKTVLSKGTKTDKVAAYTLLIQDSPLYNLGLLKSMVEMVKIGKNKECFMAVDTLSELFLKDLLPPDRKLLPFAAQPLSKLEEISSGNVTTKNRKLLLWYFEDQLKSTYGDFVNLLTKIAYDSVEANKQKVISVMYKLLEGNPEMENMLLNTIVNKLGDPSRKVGSKVIYVLMKLLQTHPNMKEVVADAVEKVIFRNNITKRAQYYSICFLSQFCLFKGDNNIAKKLITIYLSLFKACTKTGEIDSRMMNALLAGVNRAFPYLKDDYNLIQDHVHTLYKIIHLSQANIAIQSLSLVYLISDYSNSCVDRFYSVLYKKLGEVEIFQSTHHAMLINLVFKALKKDTEKSRVCTFIKRLFQACAYIPTTVACGVLIMISEVLKLKGDILLSESIPDKFSSVKLEDDSDDGDEHYEDVSEDKVIPPKVSDKSNEIKEEEEEEVKEDKKMVKSRGAVASVVPAPETQKVWSNPYKTQDDEKPSDVRDYDPFVRNPLYSGAQNCLAYELFQLSKHFHPTVSLFANKIINGESITYSGDPLLDFTLMRFLDKFSFKNPKVIKPEEERVQTFARFDRKKYYQAAPVRRLRANTAEYLKQSESSIPVDERFLYRYMKEKSLTQPRKSKAKDDDSDLESVGSDEFDNLMDDIVEGKKDEIDFHNEVGQLPKKDKKKASKSGGDDDDLDDDEGSDLDLGDDDDDDGDEDVSGDDGSLGEDFEGNEIDDGSDSLDEFGGSDMDEDEAELLASGFQLPDLSALKNSDKKKKKLMKKGEGFNKKALKKGKGDFNSLFASADEFAEVLEEADYNGGGSQALSNKDQAGMRQLKWESDRDNWINKKNFKRKPFKRPHPSAAKKKGSNNVRGVKKKKRY